MPQNVPYLSLNGFRGLLDLKEFQIYACRGELRDGRLTRFKGRRAVLRLDDGEFP